VAKSAQNTTAAQGLIPVASLTALAPRAVQSLAANLPEASGCCPLRPASSLQCEHITCNTPWHGCIQRQAAVFAPSAARTQSFLTGTAGTMGSGASPLAVHTTHGDCRFEGLRLSVVRESRALEQESVCGCSCQAHGSLKKKRLVKEIVWKTTTMCTKRFTHLMTITMPLRSTFSRGLQKVFSCDQGLSLASAQRNLTKEQSLSRKKRENRRKCAMLYGTNSFSDSHSRRSG
jgi:hypothetical protein